MKNLLTLIAALFLTFTGYAQTRTGNYTKVTADHHGTKSFASTTIKYKPGIISIGPKFISIDSTGAKPQVYQIVSRSNVEDLQYDDDSRHYAIEKLTLIYAGKSGLKAMEAILMLDQDKKTITDLILKKSKSQEITYTF